MEASKISQEEEWNRRTWNSEQIADIIASSSEMIRVVSRNPGRFGASVHKELLCYFSPYYTAALKGGFSEAKKDTVTVDLLGYQISNLIMWLYSGNIIATDEGDLFKLYVFADERLMVAFRRSIMTRMIQIQGSDWPELDVMEALPYLNRIPENSGLFRYLVDYWVCNPDSWNYNKDIEDLDEDERIPRAFLYQVMKKLTTLVSRLEAGYHFSCAYEVACGAKHEDEDIPLPDLDYCHA
ncbi:hypothetical protein E4T48_00747 [Aureobasidium sp. EXF-10727]|nr:hypothetical protein E4T48_00747 [Aureobasidium sp. EXF-10727]